MKAVFFSPWKNVWVDYIDKYFKDTDIQLDFDISYQINLNRMYKYDVAIFGWCDPNIVKLSKWPFRYCTRYIVFVRSYEIFFGYVNKVAWKNINDVIFVNWEFYNEFKPKLEPFGCRVHYLPNAIDLEKWKKQDHAKGFNVAMVANLSHKKGVDLIPQFLYKLVQEDKRYFLHIAGRKDESRHVIYMQHLLEEMGLLENYKLYGKVDNVQEWLKDKDYLFTCSVTEGCPNNVIEAMALGIKPIIHNWIGAKHDFPHYLIWDDLDKAVDLVTRRGYLSDFYRYYAEQRFDMYKIYPQLEEILRLESKNENTGN